MKILVFDSGLGGVPVLARLKRFCPHADYVYASDPVHMPYGERDGDEVTRLVRDRIASVPSDLIVLACNTATALAATALRAEFRTRIYGIEPAIKPARMLAHGRITVLSTPATARARAEAWTDARVIACPMLATQIEQDPSENNLARLAAAVAEQATRDIVLGCTHYSFLAPALVSQGFRVYDGADGLVRNVLRQAKDEGNGRIEWIGKDYSSVLAGVFDKVRGTALY